VASGLTIKFDPASLNAALDELGKGAAAQVRPAAQAGAQVLYEEARQRCPVSDHAHFFYGTQSKKTGVRYYFEPGSLRDSIYQVYSKSNSRENAYAEYHIAWNHQKVPYGFMVEYGTSRAAASPFLRPAYDARVREALQAANARWVDGTRRVIGELGG
jgi:HK97 gp10 family phage protein